MLGYSKIPDYWKQGLAEAEKIDFKYTTVSLSEVYDLGFKHALQNIERNGGGVDQNQVVIKVQQPVPVRFEESFANHTPVKKIQVDKDLSKEYTFEFEGNGFVIRGSINPQNEESKYIARAEVLLDGKLVESPALPASFTTRRHELAWKYDLPVQKHTVTIRHLNPEAGYKFFIDDVIVYSEKKPVATQN
jgi:hypothetical protein